MANTIGWGKATQNNDNGFGKYQNTIGAASIYAESYAGDTAVVGTSAAFSYSASSYNQGEADPTPTITGTTGGFFTSDAGVSFIDTSTGQIDLSASTIATHAITYIVDGVQSTQNVGITAIPYQSTSSFSFDGINDRFFINSGNDIDLGLNSTLSFWMNGASSYNGYILGKSGTNQGVIHSSTGVFYVYLSGNWWDNFNLVPAELPAGTWKHVAVVRTTNGSSSSVTVYVNGTSIQTQSKTASFFLTTTTKVNQIGAMGTAGGYNSGFEGKLDEVSLWNTALSTDAITEIYNSGTPNSLTSLTHASSSALVAWYKMGE
jgi:hypothetical protein